MTNTVLKPYHGRKLVLLDGVRGGAALYVVVSHALTTFTAFNPGPWAGRSWWEWTQVASIFTLRYASEAVILFFVLSGIVIHFRLAQNRQSGCASFNLNDYARRRLLRLYPPLVGCLLFTAVIDVMGRIIKPDIYSSFDYSWTTGLGNLLFLTDFVVPAFGSNGSLWSLAYEAFFYIFYPVAFVPLYLRHGPRQTFGLWLTACAMITVLWVSTGEHLWSIGGYLGIWLLGAVIAEALAADWHWSGRVGLWILALIGIVALMLLYENLGGLYRNLYLLLWGICWVAILLSMVTEHTHPLIRHAKRAVELFKIFAPFSYTMFVFHMPLMRFMATIYLTFWPYTATQDFRMMTVAILMSVGLPAFLARWLERVGRS